MQTWKKKIADFKEKLAEEKRCFSTKRLCDSFFQEPYSEFWQQQDDVIILEYVRDWKSVDDAHVAFWRKWHARFSGKLALQWGRTLECGDQDVRKMQELIDLLGTNQK